MYVMTAIIRQMEAMGQLGWRKPTFDEYANYLYKKLQVYTAGAAEKGRSGQFPFCCHVADSWRCSDLTVLSMHTGSKWLPRATAECLLFLNCSVINQYNL